MLATALTKGNILRLEKQDLFCERGLCAAVLIEAEESTRRSFEIDIGGDFHLTMILRL